MQKFVMLFLLLSVAAGCVNSDKFSGEYITEDASDKVNVKRVHSNVYRIVRTISGKNNPSAIRRDSDFEIPISDDGRVNYIDKNIGFFLIMNFEVKDNLLCAQFEPLATECTRYIKKTR